MSAVRVSRPVNREAFAGYGKAANSTRRDPITVHMATCQLPADECQSDNHVCPVCKKRVEKVVREATDKGVKIHYVHDSEHSCAQMRPYEQRTQ